MLSQSPFQRLTFSEAPKKTELPTPTDPPKKKRTWWKILLTAIILGPKGGLGTILFLSLIKPYLAPLEPYAIPLTISIISIPIVSGQHIKNRLPDDIQKKMKNGAKPFILHLPLAKKALVIYHPTLIKKVPLKPKPTHKKPTDPPHLNPCFWYDSRYID